MEAGKKLAYDGTCRDYVPQPGDPRTVRLTLQGTKRWRNSRRRHHQREGWYSRNSELDDLILVRSDGAPVYNFCSVFDDADLHISHIVRGDDRLTNTPRQMFLFQALGAELPALLIFPLILGTTVPP